MSSETLTVFYDGRCPLCSAEMNQLSQYDKEGKLRLIDINAENFATQYPHIDKVQADRILHGQYANGDMVFGLDVTQQAWALVGKNRWLKLLRLPVIRWFADLGYLVFARYRSQISYALTGSSQCDDSACFQIPSQRERE